MKELKNEGILFKAELQIIEFVHCQFLRELEVRHGSPGQIYSKI